MVNHYLLWMLTVIFTRFFVECDRGLYRYLFAYLSFYWIVFSFRKDTYSQESRNCTASRHGLGGWKVGNYQWGTRLAWRRVVLKEASRKTSVKGVSCDLYIANHYNQKKHYLKIQARMLSRSVLKNKEASSLMTIQCMVGRKNIRLCCYVIRMRIRAIT